MDKYKNLIEEKRSPDGVYIRYNKRLGSGAYKEVFLGYDTDRGIDVAWNEVSLSQVSEVEKSRISRETQILQTLRHPNIIDFYHVWEDREENKIIFTTEIVSTGTLKDFSKRSKDRPKIKLIKKWCGQILDVLHYLHTRDPPVIHRDLKCDNIFINGSSGELKVGDLGLSSNRFGPVKTVLGTPEFMAPELYDENYSESVDIYAFGMCVLELCTSEYPYEECVNPAQIYKKVISGDKPKALLNIMNYKVRTFIEICVANVNERLCSTDLMEHPFLRFDSPEDEFAVQIKPVVNETVPKKPTDAKIKTEKQSHRPSRPSKKKGKGKIKSGDKGAEEPKGETPQTKNNKTKVNAVRNKKKNRTVKKQVKISSVENITGRQSESSEETMEETMEEKGTKERKNKSKSFETYDEEESEEKVMEKRNKLLDKPNVKFLAVKMGKIKTKLVMKLDDNRKRSVLFKIDTVNDNTGRIAMELGEEFSLRKKDCEFLQKFIFVKAKNYKNRFKKTKKMQKRSVSERDFGRYSKNKTGRKELIEKSKMRSFDFTKMIKNGEINLQSLKFPKINTKTIHRKEKTKKPPDKIKIEEINSNTRRKSHMKKSHSQFHQPTESESCNSYYSSFASSFIEKNRLSMVLLQDLRQKMLLYYDSLSLFSNAQLQRLNDVKNTNDATQNNKKIKDSIFQNIIEDSVEDLLQNKEKFGVKYGSPLSLFAGDSRIPEPEYYDEINEKNLTILWQNTYEYLQLLDSQRVEIEHLRLAVEKALPVVKHFGGMKTFVPSKMKKPVLLNVKSTGLTGNLPRFLATPDCSDNLEDFVNMSYNSLADMTKSLKDYTTFQLLNFDKKSRKEKFSMRTEKAILAELEGSEKGLEKLPKEKLLKMADELKLGSKKAAFRAIEQIKAGQAEKTMTDAVEAEERLMGPILNFKPKAKSDRNPKNEGEKSEVKEESMP